MDLGGGGGGGGKGLIFLVEINIRIFQNVIYCAINKLYSYSVIILLLDWF